MSAVVFRGDVRSDVAVTDNTIEPSPLLILVRDLMFSGRIGAEARAANVSVKMLRDPAKLAELRGSLLIVDLNLEGALEAAGAWKAGQNGRQVVGFVQHTDAERISAARSAGIDQVMPRSRFIEVLPAILSNHPKP